MATIICLVTNILQNIFFRVQHMKGVHSDFKQLEGERMMTEFSFLVELSLCCFVKSISGMLNENLFVY